MFERLPKDIKSIVFLYEFNASNKSVLSELRRMTQMIRDNLSSGVRMVEEDKKLSKCMNCNMWHRIVVLGEFRVHHIMYCPACSSNGYFKWIEQNDRVKCV